MKYRFNFWIGLMDVTHQNKNEVPKILFAMAAMFNVLSKVVGNLSFQFIPYPTQIVAKCKL